MTTTAAKAAANHAYLTELPPINRYRSPLSWQYQLAVH